MVRRVGLGPRFFYICLDRATALACCAAGYRAALLDASAAAAAARAAHADGDSDGMAKKKVVYTAKYAAAQLLAAVGFDFFFFEMDVWMLRAPIDMAAVRANATIDLHLALHQVQVRSSFSLLMRRTLLLDA